LRNLEGEAKNSIYFEDCLSEIGIFLSSNTRDEYAVLSRKDVDSIENLLALVVDETKKIFLDHNKYEISFNSSTKKFVLEQKLELNCDCGLTFDSYEDLVRHGKQKDNHHTIYWCSLCKFHYFDCRGHNRAFHIKNFHKIDQKEDVRTLEDYRTKKLSYHPIQYLKKSPSFRHRNLSWTYSSILFKRFELFHFRVRS